MLQPDGIQALHKQIPLVGVGFQQFIVILPAKAQAGDDSLLQGRGGAYGQEVVDLFDAVGDLGRGDGVAQPPAGDGVGFGQRRAGDRALPHTGQAGKVGVGVRCVDDMLIHFVGDDVGVVLFGQVRDGFQLSTGEHLAAGVGRVAQDQGLGVLLESSFQLVHVKIKRGRVQRHINRLGPGKDRVSTVILVKRRKHDDLVAGVGHRHHGSHHGLGAAAGGHDLAVGVDFTAHQAALLFGQRLAEVLRAPGDGILVEILVGDLGQAVQNSLGRVKVRESLGQVDRAVLVGDAGHPPDDRIRKMRCARG